MNQTTGKNSLQVPAKTQGDSMMMNREAILQRVETVAAQMADDIHHYNVAKNHNDSGLLEPYRVDLVRIIRQARQPSAEFIIEGLHKARAI